MLVAALRRHDEAGMTGTCGCQSLTTYGNDRLTVGKPMPHARLEPNDQGSISPRRRQAIAMTIRGQDGGRPGSRFGRRDRVGPVLYQALPPLGAMTRIPATTSTGQGYSHTPPRIALKVLGHSSG
jgi:hypothetical protein